MFEAIFYLAISFTLSGKLCPCTWFSQKNVSKKVIMPEESNLYCIEDTIDRYKKRNYEYKKESKKYIRRVGLPICLELEKEIDKNYEPKTILYSLETVDAAKKRLFKDYPITFSKKPAIYKSQLIKAYKMLKMIIFFLETQEIKSKQQSCDNRWELFDTKKKEIKAFLKYKQDMDNHLLASFVGAFKTYTDDYFKKLTEREKEYNKLEKTKIFLHNIKNTSVKQIKKKIKKSFHDNVK